MSSRRARQERASEQILEAAAEAIAEHGFHGMSMRALASATGMSLANFYNYFDSKEELLFELHTRAFSALQAAMEAEMRKTTAPEEQLYLFIANHVEYFVQHTAVMRVLVHEAGRLATAHRPEVRRIKDEYFSRLRCIIDRLLEQNNELDPHEIDRATYCVFGMLNWVYAWYDAREHESSAEVARTIYNMTMTGIAGHRRASARSPSEELLDIGALPSPIRRKESLPT